MKKQLIVENIIKETIVIACSDGVVPLWNAQYLSVVNMYHDTFDAATAIGESFIVIIPVEFISLNFISNVKWIFKARDISFAPVMSVTSVPDNQVETVAWKLHIYF